MVHASRRRSGSSTATSRGSALGALFGNHSDPSAGQRSRSLAASIKEAVVGGANQTSRGVSRGPASGNKRNGGYNSTQNNLPNAVSNYVEFAPLPVDDEQLDPIQDAMGNHQCTVSPSGEAASAGIRTKVFRMGAPLLRSTIPLTLSSPRQTEASILAAAEDRARRQAEAGADESDYEGSDVETVLTMSDNGADDKGALSVTLDFPC